MCSEITPAPGAEALSAPLKGDIKMPVNLNCRSRLRSTGRDRLWNECVHSSMRNYWKPKERSDRFCLV